MKTIISENTPSLELKEPNPIGQQGSNRKTETRLSKQHDNETNSKYITRQVLEKSENVETAESFFEVLLKSANKPNSLGRIFIEEEIGQAFIECMDIFNPPPLDGTDKGPKGKGKGKGTSKGGKSQKQKWVSEKAYHYRTPWGDVHV